MYAFACLLLAGIMTAAYTVFEHYEVESWVIMLSVFGSTYFWFSRSSG